MECHDCVCVKFLTLCDCLCSSSRFSATYVHNIEIVNQCSWFWKSLSMADWGCGLSFFHFHFHKFYDHQIWQAGPSRRVDSSETNQAGADACDKLKTLYLHYQSAYDHHTWQDSNLPWWAPAHKVTWPFDHVVLQDYVIN